MDHLERLWLEILQESDTDQIDLIYNDVISAGDSHRLWNSAADESLRRVISAINFKLNDPSTREYGMVALSRFIEQVDPLRFVAISDGLSSSLHLSLKCLEVETTHQFLAKIMGHCRQVPELSQIVTSAVVPKILSSFCSSTRTLSRSELQLVRVCLQRYHGPCGNQRTNLETRLVALLDSTVNDGELNHVCGIIPLISSAGGGGGSGSKHSDDWQSMVRKILANIEDCLVVLFGDACPTVAETVFGPDAARLSLSILKERNVFQRITIVKIRLVKLLKLLGHYLIDVFPAPKPIPMKFILTIVRKLMILDPLNILKPATSVPKEFIYLSVVIPEIRLETYHLLETLIQSVGTNIFTEASTLEEVTLQELKWMSERPEAFTKLKTGLYSLILTYLDTTRRQAHSKTVAALAKHLIGEIELRKKTVELNQGQRSKGQKRKGGSGVGGKGSVVMSTLSSGSEIFFGGNPKTVKLALEILAILIPSLDAVTHKIVQVNLGRTAVTVLESETFPSPYIDPACRSALYDTISSLVQNPHPMSPISMSFFGKLLVQTELDDSLRAHGQGIRSWLERLAHPIGPTLNFPTVLPPLEDAPALPSNDTLDVSMVDQDVDVELTDSFCQTEDDPMLTRQNPVSIPTVPAIVTASQVQSTNLDQLVRSALESTLQRIFKGSKPPLGTVFEAVNEAEESEDDGSHFASALSSPQIQNVTNDPSPSGLTNGGPKRKYDDAMPIVEPTLTTNGYQEWPVTKRTKGNNTADSTEDGHLSFELMLSDFVEG